MSDNRKSPTPRQNPPNLPSWLPRVLTAFRLILGAVFLTSGALKVLDAQSFVATLPLYHLPGWLTPAGALLPTVETILGIALLMGVVPKLTALATLVALGLFSTLLVVGILGGDLASCGCFGRLLETSPGIALIRNLVLVLLAGAMWRFTPPTATRWRTWKVGSLAALLLALGTLTGYTIHHPQLDTTSAQPGTLFPDEGFVADPPEMEGRQLVFIFSVTCEHCWNAVANVKALSVELPDYEVFGVTLSASHELGWFVEEFKFDLPIYRYDPDLFAGTFRAWPALYVLEDGLIIGKLDHEVPAPKTLMEMHMPQWQ